LAAAENQGNGKEVMTLLLNQRGDQITVTEEAVSTIANTFDKEVMTLLLDKCRVQVAISAQRGY
jgi:hypothetical protein